MSSTTPDTIPTPTATPEPAPVALQPDNVDGLKRKNVQLIGQLKKLKVQLAERTTSRGTEPAAPSVDLAPVLVRSGLLARDNDLDYVAFTVERTPELRALAAEGKMADLLAKLTERGLVVAPTAGSARGILPNPDLPPNRPPTPTPARPPMGAVSGDSRRQSPGTFVDLMRQGTEAVMRFEHEHPHEYERMKAEHIGALASPGRR